MDLTTNILDDFFGIKNSHIDYEKELNEEQYEAVKTTEGPVLILAGAGSGKTHTLTYRIAHLIEKGVSPQSILLLTFTNRAATSMISRANNMLGVNTKIQGGTYHAFCANLLRKYGKKVGFEQDFLIRDTTDAADMINYVKELNNMSKEKDLPRGAELVSIFSLATNKNKSIEWIVENKYPKYVDYLEEIVLIKEKYTEYKKERNILDYDDLLIYTNQLLRENDDIRRRISDTYKYIMVDEYQDSNMLQFEFIKLLRSFENQNICVVGDDQQCLVEGTLINTKNGLIPVEKITEKDEILVSSGYGTTTFVKPNEIMSKFTTTEIVSITTMSGKNIKLTGEHIVFSYKKKSKPKKENVANFFMFDHIGNDTHSFTHRIYSDNNELINELQSAKLKTYDDAVDTLKELLKSKKYSNMQQGNYAKLLKECYHFFVCADELKSGMFLVVNNNGKLINDKIVNIEREYYEGMVYDINIDFYRNYYANNICIHNCIYGFNGSNHKNIINFPKEFSPCKQIILNKNYRSNQEILDLSNAISDEAKDKFDKTLVGTHSSGHKPEIIFVEDELTESKAILYYIVKKHLDEGIPYRDMAVLIRSSNDSNMLEALINSQGKRYDIPYKKFGGLKFLERKFVKDVSAYLKVLVNPKDEISWFRILQLYINIGPVTAKKIVNAIIENGVDELVKPERLSKAYGKCLPAIYKFYIETKSKDFIQQMDDIINIHYYDARKTTIDNMKSSNSVIKEELRTLDSDIEDAQLLIEMAKPYNTASDFLNDITLDAHNNEQDTDYLTISTVHSAKGLEFDTVFIMNCVNNKFPLIKRPSANTEEAKKEAEEEYEEERRVFYVAVTRAKENLHIFVPSNVMVYGKAEMAEISNFLVNNLEYCKLTNLS